MYFGLLSRPATSAARVFGEVSYSRRVFDGNDPRGRKQPVETQVYLTGSDGARVTSSSPKDGTFAFSNLAAGRYTVSFSPTVRIQQGHAFQPITTAVSQRP